MTKKSHHLRSLALSTMAVFIIGLPCAAQDDEPEPLPAPEVFISAVREAYRAGPIGEHVTVRVKDATGRSTTSRFRVFLNVDSVGDADALRIEFDPLRLWWGGGTLVAISDRNETTFYSEPLPGKPDLATISGALRPIPLPQLELAFSDDVSFSMPTPYTPGTIWTSATLGTRGIGGPEVVIIEGFSASRALSITVDPNTDRLIALHAEIGPTSEPDAVIIDLDFRPLAARPVDGWKIDTTPRTRVGQIIDLFPRRGPVRVGERAPEIALLNQETTRIPWRLGRALAAMTALENPPHALALVLFRHDGDDQTQSEFVTAAQHAVAAIDTVQATPLSPVTNPQLVQPGVTTPWRVPLQAGVVFRLGDYEPLVYRQLVERWREELPAQGTLLWDHSPSQSIDWFDTDAGAVLVLIGLDGTLLLIEALDAGTNSDDLAVEIETALRLAHPPYSLLMPPGEPAVDDPSRESSPPLPF